MQAETFIMMQKIDDFPILPLFLYDRLTTDFQMPTQKNDVKNFNYFDDNTCGR